MSENRWNFEEGDEIVAGRYALQLLGGGNRYEAYLAWDDAMHTLVVAKLLRPNAVENQAALRTLKAEADALAALAHPVLLRSFDVVTEGPRPHLVLEHLEGPRLSTLLRKQRKLAIEQAVPLGVQLSSALIYMHHNEIVHLDVKPKNIIMGGPPRLIDLSVARSFAAAAGIKDMVGTDAYMAPEQCEPKLLGGAGPASDVWGWGVTMYEALTGRLPFPRVPDSDGDARFPQLHLDPAPMDETPDRLVDLIMSTLAKRPNERPGMHGVAADLEEMSAMLPRRYVLNRLR
ncbi:MAG: protein kinase, partial [Actinobacteria bacterium]|nr:protein kinase [Actinomycetota bacterium]